MRCLKRFLPVLIMLLALACSSDPDAKLREAFKEVGVGMSREKVTEIMGEPDKEINRMTGNLLIWNNEDGLERVEIKMALNKVVYYKWKE